VKLESEYIENVLILRFSNNFGRILPYKSPAVCSL